MFEHTDYVYEVYLARSFSGAAKNLFISQPALSASVKKIEKQMGVPLFDRSTTPISLTPAGKVYIDTYEQIRALRANMFNEINDLSQLKTGKVIISGENYVSSFILPQIILTFSRRYSGITVELVESNTHDLKNRVLDEEIDLLAANDFDPELFVSYPLMDETILLVVPAELSVNKTFTSCSLSAKDIVNCRHLQEDCPTVPLQAFANTDFLILKKGNDIHNRAMLLCEQAGFVPHIPLMPDQLLTAYNMAKSGLGVAFVPDYLVRSEPAGRGCRIYKLAGENTRRQLCIGCKRKRYLSLGAQAFVRTALEIYGNNSKETAANE